MNNTPARIPRRRLLTTGLGLGTAAALTAVGTGGTASAASVRTTRWAGGTSANGWPVVTAPPRIPIEGSGLTVAVTQGAPASVLLYVARRFHYEIDTLRVGDVEGHRSDRTIDQAYESNHLSGTAITIRPLLYPVGAAGGLFPNEVVVVRDILAECEGMVRWGGDERTPKESHFHIAVKPGDRRLTALATRIAGWDSRPGQGAGAMDAFLPERRRKAARATR